MSTPNPPISDIEYFTCVDHSLAPLIFLDPNASSVTKTLPKGILEINENCVLHGRAVPIGDGCTCRRVGE